MRLIAGERLAANGRDGPEPSGAEVFVDGQTVTVDGDAGRVEPAG